MIEIKQEGGFKKMEKFLKRVSDLELTRILHKHGQAGVVALASATPIDTGNTAGSWGHEIEKSRTSFAIHWTNTNIVGGTPIAILLQYGHGTGTGGYVKGRDYINPALRPIFDKIAKEAWREVTQGK